MMHRWTPRVGIPGDYMFTVRIWMLVCTPTAASGRDVARHGDSIVDCFKHGRDAIFAVNSINVAYRSSDGADVTGDDASRSAVQRYHCLRSSREIDISQRRHFFFAVRLVASPTTFHSSFSFCPATYICPERKLSAVGITSWRFTAFPRADHFRQSRVSTNARK